MAQEIINVDSLRNLYRTNKFIIEGIENHHDEITSHIMFMHGHLSSLIGPTMVQATKGLRIKPEAFCEVMKQVLRHLMALCDLMEYDLPEADQIESFEESLDPIIKNDTLLTLTFMMREVLDILHALYVDRDTVPVWSECEVPEDIEDNIFSVIVGIRYLGKKQGFTFKDVISGL